MLVTLSGMVTLVNPVHPPSAEFPNAEFPMPTTVMLFIVGGITTAPAPGQPLYPVIVTVPPDTVYSKSPDIYVWAKAILGRTKAKAIMTE